MKPFTQIAIPHEDIVEGRLTMDVFAADLWQVANGRAPEDYQDSDLFFKKTYITEGLRNILKIAKYRLEGKTGDSTIQLQTPFGGGKTHTLIALYHKAKKWNAKVVVLDGTTLNPKEIRLWEELEKQLTGKIEITAGEIAPGKEVLLKLLSENSPVLVLMDEVLEYITKAAGIKVGDSNLAAQTFAFIQELTGAVSAVGNALLVLTLPSSILEHYDENAEKMFQQLQKITGRIEKIYAPVKDDEIEHVIRARLFREVDKEEAKKIVDYFVDYARKENLLSEEEISEYRERFLKSYPFKPEVVDVLYKRWGSFATFQRTRGVLRLLSIVVHDLLDKNVPFIRLGDFNLDNEELRRELIKHIGQEWDSIIAQDITSKGSGARKVDEMIGSSYLSYKLGTVVSRTIFMTSFSGRGERGLGIKEIKLSTVEPSFPSNVIDTVINYLKEKLFYLSDEGLFFVNQPNLNKIIVSREENISDEEIREEEKEMIKRHISRETKFKVYIHPKFSKDVPDDENLKLVILDSSYPDREFLESRGESPRVYRNTLIFLCTDENQKETFYSYVRRLITLRQIEQDKKLNLSDAQKSELKNKVKNHENREYEELRKFYRKLFIPDRNGFKEFDLSLPTFDESKIDEEIYNYLRNQEKILEKISPKVIKSKYLSERDFIEVKTLYESFLKTPGELIVSKEGFINGIKEGVKNGLFGFGYLEDDAPVCKYIGEDVEIDLYEGEIITKPELCREEEKVEEKIDRGRSGVEDTGEEITEGEKERENEIFEQERTEMYLKLDVPVGQISSVVRIINYLREKFEQCEVKITIRATNGRISKSEYEDKILEALNQANIKIEEEK